MAARRSFRAYLLSELSEFRNVRQWPLSVFPLALVLVVGTFAPVLGHLGRSFEFDKAAPLSFSTALRIWLCLAPAFALAAFAQFCVARRFHSRLVALAHLPFAALAALVVYSVASFSTGSFQRYAREELVFHCLSGKTKHCGSKIREYSEFLPGLSQEQQETIRKVAAAQGEDQLPERPRARK